MTVPADAPRLGVLAAALTLLSGGVMMAAGYVGGTESWVAAGFITLPGGLLISAAFALVRRADQPGNRASGPTRIPRRSRLAAAAVTLLSGGAMVVAGYAGPEWGWALAALLAAAGGLVITVAFAIARRGTEAA